MVRGIPYLGHRCGKEGWVSVRPSSRRSVQADHGPHSHRSFKTLWISYEEFHPVSDLYLKPDLIAGDLNEGARKILEWESQNA